jgi:hypothetical protein
MSCCGGMSLGHEGANGGPSAFAHALELQLDAAGQGQDRGNLPVIPSRQV